MSVRHLLQSEDNDTVFEYLVREDNAEWQHWRECVPSWKYPKEQERPKFAQLVIPTLDSVRYEKLLTLAYSVQKVGLNPSITPCNSWTMQRTVPQAVLAVYVSKQHAVSSSCAASIVGGAWKVYQNTLISNNTVVDRHLSWWEELEPPRPQSSTSSCLASTQKRLPQRPSPSPTLPHHRSSKCLLRSVCFS